MSLADAKAAFDNDTVKTQTVDANVKNDVNTLIAAFNKLTAFADSQLTDQSNEAAVAVVKTELGTAFPNIGLWSQDKTPRAWFRVLGVIIDARNVALQKGLTNTVEVLKSALNYVARSDAKANASTRARGARLLLTQLGQAINDEMGSLQPNALLVSAATTQLLEPSGVDDDEKSQVVVTQPPTQNEPVANVMASPQIVKAKKRIGNAYNKILSQISKQKEAAVAIPSDAFANLVAVTTAVFTKLNEPAPVPTSNARAALLQVASGDLKTKIERQLAAVANTADVSAYLPQVLLQLVQLQTAARTKKVFYAERFFSDLINVLLSERNVQRLRSILKTLDAKVKLTTAEIGIELKIPVGKRSPNSNIPAFGGSAERFPASPQLVRPTSPLRPESTSTEITAVRRQSPQQRDLPPLNSASTILQQMQNANQSTLKVLTPPQLIAAAAAARNITPSSNPEQAQLAEDIDFDDNQSFDLTETTLSEEPSPRQSQALNSTDTTSRSLFSTITNAFANTVSSVTRSIATRQSQTIPLDSDDGKQAVSSRDRDEEKAPPVAVDESSEPRQSQADVFELDASTYNSAEKQKKAKLLILITAILME